MRQIIFSAGCIAVASAIRLSSQVDDVGEFLEDVGHGILDFVEESGKSIWNHTGGLIEGYFGLQDQMTEVNEETIDQANLVEYLPDSDYESQGDDQVGN